MMVPIVPNDCQWKAQPTKVADMVNIPVSPVPRAKSKVTALQSPDAAARPPVDDEDGVLGPEADEEAADPVAVGEVSAADEVPVKEPVDPVELPPREPREPVEPPPNDPKDPKDPRDPRLLLELLLELEPLVGMLPVKDPRSNCLLPIVLDATGPSMGAAIAETARARNTAEVFIFSKPFLLARRGRRDG